nr:MAG TPA: hypothetical protein [Caudoviricetes sp.]
MNCDLGIYCHDSGYMRNPHSPSPSKININKEVRP